MTKIQLFYAPGACSILPHIVLHETGLPFEAIEVKRANRHEAWPAEYKRINPKFQVPALVLDDEVITENIAVCTAISNLVPEMHLLGKSTMENVRAYEWLSWLAINLHTGGFQHVFRPYRWSDDPSAHEGIQTKALERIGGIIDAIEERLTGVHAVGDGFTAVDAYLFAFYRWAIETKFDMKTKYPRYTALIENLVKREGVMKAIKAEGLEGTW